MPPKKAPKHAGSDARKAFEHLGRVQSIASFASAEQGALAALLSAADAAFQSHHYKESAHLLRAAEHLLFAAVVDTNPAPTSQLLQQAIEDEFAHLAERAEEHGRGKGLPTAILGIYERMQKDAAVAIRSRQFRRALELARGAEALTHLHVPDHDRPLPAPVRRRLKA